MRGDVWKRRYRQICGHTGKIDLQRGRDIQHRAGIGGFDVAVQKLIGQGLDPCGLARAQPRDDLSDLRRQRAAIEMIEKHGEAIAPGGIPAVSIRGERRHPGLNRLLDGSLFRTGE